MMLVSLSSDNWMATAEKGSALHHVGVFQSKTLVSNQTRKKN